MSITRHRCTVFSEQPSTTETNRFEVVRLRPLSWSAQDASTRATAIIMSLEAL